MRDGILAQVRQVIVGQDEVLDQILIALFVGGHCLITGMPGTAKTLMVRTIAETLGLTFRRIQFTPDLMPSDITGTDIIEEDVTTGHRKWTFVEGPIFGNVVLADEINRTPPKTQAAHAGGDAGAIVHGAGGISTNCRRRSLCWRHRTRLSWRERIRCPEAQLDRFLFNTLLDYLSASDELKVVDLTTATKVVKVSAVTSAEELLEFQQLVRMVPIGESLARYVVNLVRATRHKSENAPDFVKKYVNYGGSIRAAQFIVLAAKARALLRRRYHVTYDDITALVLPVLRHRILLNFHAESERIDTDEILRGCWRICRRRRRCKVQRFLDPSVLAGISGLDLVAKTVVDGFVAGLHRSPDFGFSQEFAEYRAYTPGDDLRHVDWNLFARTERCYLKRYRGETNSQLTILLDASNSMNYSSHAVSKMDYARYTGCVAVLSGDPQSARSGGADCVRRRGAELHPAVDAAGAVASVAGWAGAGGAAGAHGFR